MVVPTISEELSKYQTDVDGQPPFAILGNAIHIEGLPI